MRYEKEMIPILANYLNSNMGYSIIANELDSGYGIADIVATVGAEDYKYYPFNKLTDVFLLNSIPFNEVVPFGDILQISSYSAKHLKYVVLKGFVDGGFLVAEKRGYRRVKRLTIKKNPIIAIEAKLKKWKEAFLQATRYKKYADFCYVALPEKTFKNIDLKLFRENNIGVLAVSASQSVYQALGTRKNKDKHDLYAIYVNGILFKNKQADVSDVQPQ